jgi:hypothetical protein
MWDFLKLLDSTTDIIEDFYLVLLSKLNLARPNKFTVFKLATWQEFRNIVLKDTTIRRIIAEIDKWKDTGFGVGNPGQYLAKIRYIRANKRKATFTYENWFLQTERSKWIKHFIQSCFQESQRHQDQTLRMLFHIHRL